MGDAWFQSFQSPAKLGFQVGAADGEICKIPAEDGWMVRTVLRQTVEALVAGEMDAVPLIWLLELLARTGYHSSLTPRELIRQRGVWVRNDGFPAKMILWDQ